MIGLRRLLAAVVLIAIALALEHLLEVKQTIVRAAIADADGLAPIGADVRVAGVPVGRVRSVARDGDRALLTLALDGRVGVVHRDATASLQPRLMFEGTAFVALTLGSPAAAPLGDRILPVAQTSTYVPLADTFTLLSRATRPSIRAVATAGATALAGPSARALRGVVAAAPALLANTATVAAAARGAGQRQLRVAVRSLAAVAGAAAAQAPALDTAVAGAGRTLTAIDAGGLDPALARLPDLTAQLNGGAGAATTLLDRLVRLMPGLTTAARALAPTLSGVRPVLQRAVPVLADAGPALRDARTALAGAARGAPAARAAIAALKPTLETFQNTLLGALAAPTDLGDPAYLAFLGLFEGGGGASAPFGIDGQGHFMRFGLRFLTGAGPPLPPCTLLRRLSPALAATLSRDGGCTP